MERPVGTLRGACGVLPTVLKSVRDAGVGGFVAAGGTIEKNFTVFDVGSATARMPRLGSISIEEGFVPAGIPTEFVTDGGRTEKFGKTAMLVTASLLTRGAGVARFETEKG